MFPSLTPRKDHGNQVEDTDTKTKKENINSDINKTKDDFEGLSVSKSKHNTDETNVSRPTTSGSIDNKWEYNDSSRPSTREDRSRVDNYSRPSTTDSNSGNVNMVEGKLDFFPPRPGTGDSGYFEDYNDSETQSRPGTSGSMTISRPVTREGGVSSSRPVTREGDSDSSRPSTREGLRLGSYDNRSEYYNESENGTGSRPGTSGSMNFDQPRPGTADSMDWNLDDGQSIRPRTSDTFRRPDTADRFRSDFRPDSADTYGQLSRPGTTEGRPGTSETFRRPNTADIIRTGVRPGTAETFYTDEYSSIGGSRPQTAATTRPVVQQLNQSISVQKKYVRPVTAALDGGYSNNINDNSNFLQPKQQHNNNSSKNDRNGSKKPVGILKKKRPQTAMVKSHIPMSVVANAKLSVDNKKMRPRTAKFNLSGKPPIGKSRPTSSAAGTKQNHAGNRPRQKNKKRPISGTTPLPIEPDPLSKSNGPKIVITKSPKKLDFRPSKLLKEDERVGGFGKRPYNLTEREKRKVKEMAAIGKTMKRKAQKLRNTNKLRVSRDPFAVKDAKEFFEELSRPQSAASQQTSRLRPRSPSPIVPHPRGGKVLPRPATASIMAQMKKELENDEDNNPWEVNLSSSIPIPRTAARATSPPTDAQRRPWVPEKKRMPEGWKPKNPRPWSTDETLTRNGVNRGSILLADGRPHTVGSLPRPTKILSYNEAYNVSQSHSEARKIIKMQHKLVDEDQHRMYEDWVLDKADLALTKRNVKSWGTKGPGVTENPVVRAFKKADSKKKQGKKGLSPKKRHRPHTVTGATGQKSERRKMIYKYKDEKTYHVALLDSYRTGELEILWQGLEQIPRRIAFNTLLLSMHHLHTVRLSGNKLATLPSWYFTTLHCTTELNIGNNRLKKLPEALGLMHQLVKFACPQNRITYMPQSFTKLTNLTQLKAAGNGLSMLPKRIGHLYKLRIVRLEDNNLRTLPGDFQKLIKLQDLSLNRNRMGSLALITPLDPPKKRTDNDEDWFQQKVGDFGMLWFNKITGQCRRYRPAKREIENKPNENLKIDLTKLKQGVKQGTLDSAFDGLTNLQKRGKLGEEGRGVFDVRFDPIEGFPFFVNNLTNEKIMEMPYELDNFGRVGNLKRLNLSFNILHDIPKSIGKLHYLMELILDHNKLTILPKEIEGLFRLKTLSVVDNRLKEVPAEISKMTSLERLAVNYNKLKELPPDIAELPKLTRLWISNNYISVIPAQYYKLTLLTQLYAGDNPWETPPKKTVEKGIIPILRDCKERWERYRRGGRPPEVKTVSVGILSEVVVPEPRYQDKLEFAHKSASRTNQLRLQWLQLKEIPPQFYELTSLTDLGVMCNLLTAIPITLCKRLTALTTLNMYNNQLTSIPDGISALKNLTSLNLERNKIEKISGRISFLNHLKYLRLTANRIKTLPDKIHRLKNIQELHLDVNNIHKLPDAIVELPKLRILLLMKNKLRKFPPNITHLQRLEVLNLNQNSVTRMPKGIHELHRLKELYLSHNRVQRLNESFGLGSLQSTLTKLWLYGNNIIELPYSFRFLTSLDDLRLEHNPMRSPPPALALEGPKRIRIYLEDRISRNTAIKDALNTNLLRFNSKNLGPKSLEVLVRSKYLAADTTVGYLNNIDLKHIDKMVDNYINADYYNYDLTLEEIVDWIQDTKEVRRIEFQKDLLNKFLIWIEWAEMEENGQSSLLTDDIFRSDMVRKWGEEVQGERTAEPVFALVTPAVFRKQRWTPADDGIEEKEDNEVGDEEDIFKSIIDRGNDRIDRRNAHEEHEKMIKRDYTFEYVPTFDFSERQLLEASKMFIGPYGSIAELESGVKFQLDKEGKARAKIRAQERLEKIREIERKRRHKIKMEREKKLLDKKKAKEKKKEMKKLAKEGRGAGDTTIGEKKDSDGENIASGGEDVTSGGEDATSGDEEKRAETGEGEKLEEEEEEEDILLKKNDALVILKTIYTQEEVDRKYNEEQADNRAQQQARDDVTEWFELKQGKKMQKLEYKKRKKYSIKRVTIVKKAIKHAIRELKEAEKEYKYIMSRSKAYDDNPAAFENHRFNTMQERDAMVMDANLGMNKLTENLGQYKSNLEEVILLSKRKKKEIEEELYFELLEKYARVAHEKVIDEGRVYARDHKLRRPWDGRNGKFFKQWLKEQADLMALITGGGGDDSDSDSSSGDTPRDLFGFKVRVDPLETKFEWDKYIDPLEKELKEKARLAKIAKKKAKAERRALAEAAGEEFEESSDSDEDDDDDEDVED
jgi:Leucine-rich repeat (LRR) protein